MTRQTLLLATTTITPVVVVMSHHPGTIARIYDIPFERPRDYGVTADPRFVDMRGEIVELLRAKPEAA